MRINFFKKNKPPQAVVTKDAVEEENLRSENAELKNTLRNQRVALANLLEDLSEEKKLVEVQSKYLLDTIKEGIVITDASGNVVFINPAFKSLLGFTEKELVGKDFADVMQAYNMKGQKLPKNLLSNSAAVTNNLSEQRRLFQTKTGDKVALSESADPIHIEQDFKGVIRIFHDFSEDYEIQRQKDDFLAIASHELRTPLTIIAGNLSLLYAQLSEKLNENQLEIIKDSEEASDRLSKLVHDFLSVSEMDLDRLNYHLVPVDVCTVINKVIEEFTPLAEKKKLNIKSDCATSKAVVLGDERLLTEIFMNLIGNAIKFTSKGGITINHDVKSNRIAFQISDTGMGISPDKQKLMFQRFQQAMDTRTLSREVGGTGLGLYISKEFAKLMNGTLCLLDSKPEKGSTFELTFPLLSNKTIQ